MANVKAGVAYVDVRLGSLEQFKNKLKSEVEKAAAEVGKRMGDGVKKSATPSMTEAGKVTASTLSRAFLADATKSIGRGFTQLVRGNLSGFRQSMSEAGAAAGLGFRSGLEATFNGIKKAFTSIGTVASAAMGKVSSLVKSAGVHLENFSKKVGFASFQLQTLGFIASTAFTAPIVGLAAFGTIIGVKTAAQIESATVALKSMLGAGYDVDALIKRLQKLAQESPIFNTTDLITFTQQMTASGLKIKDTEAFIASFGRIALRAGADVSKIPFALQALVQMVGKGKVSMEELRLQLGDALPGAMNIVKTALGVTTDKLYEMVEAGELSGEDLVKALTKLGNTKPYLEGAASGAETMAAKWQALKEAVQTQLGNVFLQNADKIKAALDRLGPTFKKLIDNSGPAFDGIIKGFETLVGWISKLVDWYAKLTPGQKEMVNKLVLIAAVAGPVILALGALFGALAGIAAGLALFANPVGLAVAAILVLAGIFAVLYFKFQGVRDEVKRIWDSFKKYIIDPMKGPLKDTWEDIKNAWDQLVNAFGSGAETGKKKFEGLFNFLKGAVMFIAAPFALVVGIIKGVIAAIGPLFAAIVSLISGIIKFFRGLVDFLVGVFTGDWDRALKGLKLIWDGLWDAIIGTLYNLGKMLVNLVKGIVTGIVDFFKWLWDVLVGHSIIPDMVNAIIDWFKKLVKKGVDIVKGLGSFFTGFYGNYIKPFVDKVIKGGSDVLNWFKELPGKIKNALTGATSWLWNTGKDIVQGLINGVKSMGRTLVNAILSLIPGPVRSVVENALGIKSPSKVFMSIGKYIVQGLIKGVQLMTPKLASEMNTLGNVLPGNVSPTFGDPREPLFTPGSSQPKAALNIENYYANDDADPRRQAEDWYFIVSARGGVA